MAIDRGFSSRNLRFYHRQMVNYQYNFKVTNFEKINKITKLYKDLSTNYIFSHKLWSNRQSIKMLFK